MTSPAIMARQFALPAIRAVQPVGSGLLHATYRLHTTAGDFVLQRLHQAIPDVALEDMRVVTSHLAACGLQVPSPLLTPEGKPYARDAHGRRWRAYPWLPGQVLDAVPCAEIAYEAGHLVGRMHQHLAALDYTPQGSIPHFHDTAFIVAELHSVQGCLPDEARGIAEVILGTLPALIPTDVPRQLIHGDLKISNLLFNDRGQAVGIIDFDTILLHTRAVDLGDALRSWCNRTAEDDPQARFDRTFFTAAVAGYAAGFGAAVSPDEQAQHLQSARLLALELAARFLIDVVHDTYFGFDSTRYPSRRAHNLARACGQYHLAQTMSQTTI
jgi:Ser/Thr protein kinase RdoA (MazF antagonist)